MFTYGMNRYDSEYETTSDSEVSDAAEGAGRLVERYQLPVKVAVFYVVLFGVSLLAYRVVDSPNIEPLIAIVIWFTVIFAALTAVFGIAINLIEAVQRHREGHR